MKDGAEVTDKELRAAVVVRGVHFAVGAQGEVVLGARDGDGSGVHGGGIVVGGRGRVNRSGRLRLTAEQAASILAVS